MWHHLFISYLPYFIVPCDYIRFMDLLETQLTLWIHMIWIWMLTLRSNKTRCIPQFRHENCLEHGQHAGGTIMEHLRNQIMAFKDKCWGFLNNEANSTSRLPQLWMASWGYISFKYSSIVRQFHWWGCLNSNSEDWRRIRLKELKSGLAIW